MFVPPTNVIEVLVLLPGVEVCATLGPLSLLLAPLAAGIDEPPGVCVSLVAGGNGLCDCFFLPNRNDILVIRPFRYYHWPRHQVKHEQFDATSRIISLTKSFVPVITFQDFYLCILCRYVSTRMNYLGWLLVH